MHYLNFFFFFDNIGCVPYLPRNISEWIFWLEWTHASIKYFSKYFYWNSFTLYRLNCKEFFFCYSFLLCKCCYSNKLIIHCLSLHVYCYSNIIHGMWSWNFSQKSKSIWIFFIILECVCQGWANMFAIHIRNRNTNCVSDKAHCVRWVDFRIFQKTKSNYSLSQRWFWMGTMNVRQQNLKKKEEKTISRMMKTTISWICLRKF